MYIHVRVIPGAKKELMSEEKPLYFKISVKEPAERNLANERVCELIGEHFRVPRGNVRIINGHKGPTKLLSIN